MTPSQPTTIADRIDAARSLGFSSIAENWRREYLASENQTPVRIAFIGEFNHGKSSLINALCAQSILPNGMTPTTQLDTDILFDAPETCVSAWRDAECVARWTFEDWQKHAVKLTNEAIKKSAPTRIQIALALPSPIQNGAFIDTPGLNETTLSREAGLQSTLMRADIVVFVLDANQALTRTESSVLQFLAQYAELHKCLLVINKCDHLDEEDWLEICHHVEVAVAPILGDSAFFMLSARKRQIGDWNAFAMQLQEYADEALATHKMLYEARVEQVICPILDALRFTAHRLDALSQNHLKAISTRFAASPAIDRQILLRHIDGVERQIAQIDDEVRHDIERFEQNFLRAIARELDKTSIEDIAAFIEDFIDDTFARFARTLCEEASENFDNLCEKTWNILTENEYSIEFNALPGGSFFEETETLMRHPPTTGAFDPTRMKIVGFVFKPIVVGRIERPMRDTLRQMAERAIQRRSQSYQMAFGADIAHFRQSLVNTIREVGSFWRQYIAQAATLRLRAK